MHSQINSLPQYMLAISIIKPGGPEKLHLVQFRCRGQEKATCW